MEGKVAPKHQIKWDRHFKSFSDALLKSSMEDPSQFAIDFDKLYIDKYDIDGSLWLILVWCLDGEPETISEIVQFIIKSSAF